LSDLEQIYNQHVGKIYKYFYIQCLDRHLAEDLTSQTFVKLVGSSSEVDSANKTKYLYGIMRHVWADHLRQKYRQSHIPVEMIEEFDHHVERTVVDFETQSLKDRAKKFIDLLPDRQKVVATKRLLEEMTISEVAAELNKTKSYVKTTQSRALKSLKIMLANSQNQEVSV
jgi:RNA polymerase sigma-70 factor, ECF subfamily